MATAEQREARLRSYTAASPRWATHLLTMGLLLHGLTACPGSVNPGGAQTSGSSTSGRASTGTSSGNTSGSVAGSTGSSTGAAAAVTDAGCEFCLLGGGGFGSGDGLCITACPAGSHIRAQGNTQVCAYDGGGCAYPSACGASFACLDSDSANCGFCGHACGVGQVCSGYYCVATCNGTQVRVESDPANCGVCGHACAAGEVCGHGVCGVACGPSATACHGHPQLPPDGGQCATCPNCFDFHGELACLDLSSDTNHCGTCGNACGPGDSCVNGVCQQACAAGQVCADSCQATCPAGRIPCPNAHGSTCVDLQNDTNNCGTCGTTCGACAGGNCTGSCYTYGPDAG